MVYVRLGLLGLEFYLIIFIQNIFTFFFNWIMTLDFGNCDNKIEFIKPNWLGYGVSALFNKYQVWGCYQAKSTLYVTTGYASNVNLSYCE